jgi:DNA mismatch endonuclease, patch repair protein
MQNESKYRPKSKEEIARNMGAIRSKENKTEASLRKKMHRLGLRYRKYPKDIPGKPDFVFPSARVAVFVDGDFWHGRTFRERGPEAFKEVLTAPSAESRKYWVAKIERNAARDDASTAQLTSMGWKVIRIWESDVRKDIEAAADMIYKVVKGL